MVNQTQLFQITTKLNNDAIRFNYDTKRNKIILNPIDRPFSMSIPTWQFQLKLISYFNQDGMCICGNKLTNIRELHHAILSRNDIKGCQQEIKDLIHHSYNVLEICKNCHLQVTREKCSKFLAQIYGTEQIIQWYNDFPLKTKIYRIEAFLK